jgi:hypothetical protein
MRLLRSEEQLPPGGAAIPIDQLHRLASAWYGDRLDPGWRPRTPEQSQAVLHEVGLTDGFWRLTS